MRASPPSPSPTPQRRQLVVLAVAVLAAVAAVAVNRWRGNIRQEKRLAELVAALGKRTQGGTPEVSPEEFGSFGRRAGPALVAVLQSADANDLAKEQALEALGRLKDPSVFPVLKEWARNAKAGYRRSAVRGLGYLGTPDAIQHLLTLLDDPQTRVPAITALGLAHATRAREPLLRIVAPFAAEDKGGDEQSRREVEAAAEALGRIGGRGVKPALQNLLRKPETRLAAALGLAWLADPKGIDVLVTEFLGSDNPKENQQAVEVLSAAGPAVPPRLVAALSRSLPRRRLLTLVTLTGQLKVASAVAPLTAILTDEKRPLAVREKAAAALGEIGDEAAFHALLTAIPKTPDPLRRSLQFGLVKVDCPGADEVLRKTLQDANPANRQTAARLLGLRGVRKAVPDLIAALGDPDAGTRLNAVQALSTLNDPSALSALERLSSDPDVEVRRKAEAAVVRMKAATR